MQNWSLEAQPPQKPVLKKIVLFVVKISSDKKDSQQGKSLSRKPPMQSVSRWKMLKVAGHVARVS